MSRPCARLTPGGRLFLVEGVLSGHRVADVAASSGTRPDGCPCC